MSYTGSQAQAGRGSSLLIGATPIMIGEVKSAGQSGNSWGTEDVSNFESGVDQEFITTLRNNGEVRVAGNRVSSDAGQISVESYYQSGLLAAFVLQLPKTPTQTTKGDSFSFNALVKSREFTVEVEKAITFSISLMVSGPVTLTVGS